MSRDVMINIGCTAFTFAYVALCLLVGIYAYRRDLKQAQQQQEPSGIETFTPEYMEMYQTGVWLLLHDAEAPYDEL